MQFSLNQKQITEIDRNTLDQFYKNEYVLVKDIASKSLEKSRSSLRKLNQTDGMKSVNKTDRVKN